MVKRIAFALTVVGACVTGALAETPEERQACQDDAFRVCERFIPDQDRVFACLVQNNRIISALCRQALAAYLPPEPAPAGAPKQNAKSKIKDAKIKDAASKTTATSKGPLNLNANTR
ncbi:MAG: hypothetical protein QOI12_1969 [Alphaproteobacteria bacterium]|jgi:hypothetical protein|nr:hypothetical protein [Alphaproteobacteria bacterium]